jgi:GR25 family glycosyltransferase involved in LPS biosynthesis
MKNPFNFFNKIYCINLEDRTDRWEECLEMSNQYEISNLERIDAIKIESDLPPKRKGQIGCSLSYAKCINLALQNDFDNVLILEDDFQFLLDKENLHSKMKLAINDLPEDWDALYFGGTVISSYGHIPLMPYRENLLKLNGAHTTHSIAFSKKGLLKIVNFFKDKPWEQELINNYECIDVFLAKEFQHINKVYIPTELLCFQRPSKSDIENCVYDYSEWMIRNFNHFKTLVK